MVTDAQDEKEDEKAAEPARTATPAAKRKAAEPSSFTIGNMTRVTPQQLSTISFPDDVKYSPLRPLNERLSNEDQSKRSGPQAAFGAQEKKESRAVAGSIVLLRDLKPEVEAEYVELDKALWPDNDPEPESAPTPTPQEQPVTAGVGAGGELDGGEAEMPPAFEYNFD